MKRLSLLLFFFLFAFCFAQAQQLAAGTSLPDVISGQRFAFDQLKDKKALVLVFTSSYCPYSRLYEERLDQLVRSYRDKSVAFVFINPNDSKLQAEDSDESMRTKMQEWGLNIPYLRDEGQQLARQLKASKTPEVFVFKPTAGGFTLAYSGAIDDNPQVAQDVSRNYLREALDNTLSNKPVASNRQRPVGCMIKMK